MRSHKTLGLVHAKHALEAMERALVAEGRTAVLCVADAHGDLLALVRLEGAKASSVTIAINKAYTAARERVRTYDIGQRYKNPTEAFDLAYYGDPRYVGWGGGLPVLIDGEVVGAVGVSGLPELEDQRIAEVGVRAIPGSDPERTPSI
jgi:glc operon protein GlcG